MGTAFSSGSAWPTVTTRSSDAGESLGPLFGGKLVDPAEEWRGVYYFHGWSDRDFALWLAAFFDGEGNVYLPKGAGITVSVANTDRDVIESIYHRLSLGSVVRVEYDNPKWKPKWVWRVRRYDDAATVLAAMMPFLTIKSRAAAQALVRIARVVETRTARHARSDEIARLFRAGVPRDEIAARFGVSPSFVSWTARQSGQAPRLGRGQKRSVYRERYQKPKAPVPRTKSRRIR